MIEISAPTHTFQGECKVGHDQHCRQSSLHVTSGNDYTWHKQNSEVMKESVWNFEAQLKEDIDQDSGFITEVMQPER